MSNISRKLISSSKKEITISFVTSANADSSSIVIPSSAQEGDLCLFADFPAAVTSTTPIAPVTPFGVTGWTSLSLYNTLPRNDLAIFSWAKILGSSDPGSSVFGTNTATFTGYRRKILVIFRKDAGDVNTFSGPLSLNNQGTNVAPSPQVVTSASGDSPLISFGLYRCTQPLYLPSFIPTQDGIVSSGTTVQVRYKIYNSSPNNINVEMDDGGSSNMLQSFYLELA